MLSLAIGFVAGVAAAYFVPAVLAYFGKAIGYVKSKTGE